MKVCSMLLALIAVLVLVAGPAGAADKKPNILIIWGDDIGQFNVSAYNQGMMGYKTPNIDSIAREGRSSRTGMGSRAAPLAAQRSSPVSRLSAPASLRSVCLERRRA